MHAIITYFVISNAKKCLIGLIIIKIYQMIIVKFWFFLFFRQILQYNFSSENFWYLHEISVLLFNFTSIICIKWFLENITVFMAVPQELSC